MELRQRIEEEGFEIAFNPPGDGSCFYRAAAFQLGLSSSKLPIQALHFFNLEEQAGN